MNKTEQKNKMIIADGYSFDLDDYKTGLNNNVLVVGTSGSGKSRSIVSPNIIQATGSYIISDPKGKLYKDYSGYLRQNGYRVVCLDFVDLLKSDHYNPFDYIDSEDDVVKFAHVITEITGSKTRNMDDFWNASQELLLQAIIGIIWENEKNGFIDNIYIELEELRGLGLKKNMTFAMELIRGIGVEKLGTTDGIFDVYESKYPDSFAVKKFKEFKSATGKTMHSIMITVFSSLSKFESKGIEKMMRCDDINILSAADEKTAIFVRVSDTDRTYDGIANLFYSQALQTLCNYADKCPDGRLFLNVRFILDDFATNCVIDNFPQIIAMIRSRGISATVMIQDETQLQTCYGAFGKSIANNCDTYVYLGGNDPDQARLVSLRCGVPMEDILHMKLGECWIVRRGENPVKRSIFNLEEFEQLMEVKRDEVERMERDYYE